MEKTPREAASVPEPLSQPGALALYRKHRPAVFDGLVGQPAVVQGLSAAVKSGRVAHAYLFSGPRGTGKTSAARILAKCLNCLRGGPRPDPCGECEACTSIAAGTAFDVIEIDAASNRGINEIRELRERVKFAPSQFRKKVYIIDEVHMLTSEAFNALLKTLEEPPDYVVFVLATTEAHKVPATILSRCQRYEFRRMTPSDIAKRLTEVAGLEKITIAPEAVARIAYLSDGALRDALVLLDQARGFAGDGRIDGKLLDAAFGASHREIIEQIVDAIAASDAGGALTAVADAVAAGVDPSWLTKELLRWFRLALLALVSRDLIESEVSAEDAKTVGDRAKGIGRAKVLTALRHLSESAAQRYSPQPRFDLELALARIILPGDELTLRALSERLRVLEDSRGSDEPASPPSSALPGGAIESPSRSARKSVPKNMSDAAMPSVKAMNAAQLAGLWPMILTAARQRSMQAFGHLQHAAVAEASEDLITIGVDDKFNRDQLAEAKMAQLVADAIAQASGTRAHVRFIVAPDIARKVPTHASGLSLAEGVLGDDLI